MKALKKILVSVLVFLLVLVAGAIAFWKLGGDDLKKSLLKYLSKQEVVRDLVQDEVGDDYEEKIQDKDFDESQVVVDETVKEKLSGYRNIVLFGLDARGDEFDSATQSDSIIIISINNDSGEIKMVSVYRDSYLDILSSDGSEHFAKVNSSYCQGGAAEAISTLNMNLDLNITDYAVVNFTGFINIVDLFDGVDINITDAERQSLNDYAATMSDNYQPLEESGLVHLDGLRATAYCRIRGEVYYDEFGNDYHYDYARTMRQRAVLSQIIEKAKEAGISKMIEAVDTIMNMNTDTETYFKTSLSYDEIMDLLPYVIDYNVTGSIGFPYTHVGISIDGTDPVIPATLGYNVSLLHAELFGEQDYQLSEKVQSISDSLESYTGVGVVPVE